ncbi:hypothetical protein O988_06795 [Pseudogymnoascus sp. VKM F-3808]|nr:hypothetical protein O988_06795 [Pseudogymnoascus sp. VKM F-3808]
MRTRTLLSQLSALASISRHINGTQTRHTPCLEPLVAEIVFLGNYPPIGFELLDSAGFVDGRVADAVAGECAAEDDEEVAELGEDDGFGVGVSFAEPEEMSAERVHFGGERGADDVDVLDLGEGVPTYLGVYSRLLGRHQDMILIMSFEGVVATWLCMAAETTFTLGRDTDGSEGTKSRAAAFAMNRAWEELSKSER